MDPIGFNAGLYYRGDNYKQEYARDIKHLTELRLKYLQIEIKPNDGPPALRAYLNIKDGKQKGLIPDDVYRPQELERLKKIIDPIYTGDTKKILAKELNKQESKTKAQISETTNPILQESLESSLARMDRLQTQLNKLTSIDDFAKPEFRELRQEFDVLLNALQPKK